MQPDYCDCDVFHDGSCHEREIERLQHALDAAKTVIVDQQAEIERLRDALQEKQ